MGSAEEAHQMVLNRKDLGWPTYCYRFDVESMPLVAVPLRAKQKKKKNIQNAIPACMPVLIRDLRNGGEVLLFVMPFANVELIPLQF